MTVAILCSGQGRQHPEMFTLTGDVPEAATVFRHAATLLGGRDPRDIVRTEASEILHHNRTGQILCTTQALAAAAVLLKEMPDRIVVAGYSVGEIAAWGIAGLLSVTDTLDLAARRADVMDAAAAPGEGMLFVRGLSRDVVEGLCRRHDCAIAIVNPGDAFVLGGLRTSLDALAEDARALDATHVVDVPVEVASHTSRLAIASVQFRETLKRVPVRISRPTRARLLSGVDGSRVIDVEAGLDKLAAQISHTVQWSDCLEGCIEAGAATFLELGPGHALSAMVAGAYRDVAARCLEDFRTLQGARSWLARQSSRSLES